MRFISFLDVSERETNIAYSNESDFVTYVLSHNGARAGSDVGISAADAQAQIKKELGNTPKDRIYLSALVESSKTLYRKISIPTTIAAKDRLLAITDILEQSLPAPIVLSASEGEPPYALALRKRNTSQDSICYDAYIAARIDLASADAEELFPKEAPLDALFPKVAALHEWAKSAHPEQAPRLIIHVSKNETTALFLVFDEIVLTRSFSLGLDSLQPLFTQAETSPSETDSITRFFEFLRDCLQLCQKQIAETDRDDTAIICMLTGPAAASTQCSDCIYEYVQSLGAKKPSPDSPLDPVQSVFAAELGAALLGSESNLFSDSTATPNLLLSYKKTIPLFSRHAQAPLYKLAAVSLIASLCTLCWGYIESARIESAASGTWGRFQESISSFPLLPSEQAILSSDTNPSPMKQKEILSSLEAEMKKNETYRLIPNAPTFSDTLRQIDTIIKTIAQKYPEAEVGKTELQSIKYSMVKRPDMKHQKEPYQVRVDLEFTSPSQSIARNFYDALLTTKTFIDSKNELKWSAASGKYKTSFYLQPKEQMSLLPELRGQENKQ